MDAKLGISNGLLVSAKLVGRINGARLASGVNSSFVDNRVDRVDIIKLIDVDGIDGGIRLDGGHDIKDGQVDVIVVIGRVVGLGVSIQVGNVLEGKVSINDVSGGGIEDRLRLGGRFGTIMGSGVDRNLLGSIVELVNGINDGLALGTDMPSSSTGFHRSRKDVDDQGNKFFASIGWPGNGTSACDGDGMGGVSGLERAGVGRGDGIGLGDGGGIAGGLGVGTIFVGSLLGFGNGSMAGTGVIVNLVGAGVGTDDGIGLGGVDGIAEGRVDGPVVVVSLIALGDGILVRLADELAENVGPRLVIGVLCQSVELWVDIQNGVASGTGFVISLAGLGIRGPGIVGTIVGQGDGMGDGGGDGTGGVGCLVGAGVGVDDGIELGKGASIAGGLKFATGLFVGVGVGIGSVAGIRLGDGGGLNEGIEIFSADGIEDEQIDGVRVGSFGCGDGIGGVGCIVGASIGVDDGTELGGKDGIVDGIVFGNEFFVRVGVCAVAGGRLGEGVGNGEGVQIFSVDCTEDEQFDRIVVGGLVEKTVGIGDGVELGIGDGIGE